MNKDLFGQSVQQRKRDPLAKHRKSLEKYDESTRNERTQRQAVVDSMYLGRELHFMGDMEGAALFHESQRTFVDGYFAATIVLVQAIIETTLQNWLAGLGFAKLSRSGLKKTLVFLEQRSNFPGLLLHGFESLRQKRNIYIHLRPPDDDARLWKRMMETESSDWKSLLEGDAEEALRLLFTLYHLDLSKIQVRYSGSRSD